MMTTFAQTFRFTLYVLDLALGQGHLCAIMARYVNVLLTLILDSKNTNTLM